jgi:hypothetical protein
VNGLGNRLARICADRIWGNRNPCGVCAANSVARSSVAITVFPSSDRLIVSVTATTGSAASEALRPSITP